MNKSVTPVTQESNSKVPEKAPAGVGKVLAVRRSKTNKSFVMMQGCVVKD